ncbi:hypothetical protein [Coleofasciculus sp. FACHB-T130]|uniref:hypothetical protein n=1 Tax=Cyanophyceae TaxID=3028117 RepID=UPI001685548E|nr:hypothetical protein [Coleofasciculus sp. FACHB-T130]MBD1882134.1 hypothetical protein [Coleofasciculus sp. FACHB-T130]
MLAIDSDLKKAEAILLKKLQSDECSMSLYDVIDLLQLSEISDPKRIAKEAIWKMVEEGNARFTNNWSIKAR